MRGTRARLDGKPRGQTIDLAGSSVPLWAVYAATGEIPGDSEYPRYVNAGAGSGLNTDRSAGIGGGEGEGNMKTTEG